MNPGQKDLNSDKNNQESKPIPYNTTNMNYFYPQGNAVTSTPLMYPPVAVPPPYPYYYQPFRPQMAPPQGYPPQMMFYPQMYPPAAVPMNMQQNINRPPSVPIAAVTKNTKPHVTNTPKPTTNTQPRKKTIPPPKPSTILSIPYNLDDPEELEKWKAERRKKFPTGKKEHVEKEEETIKDQSSESKPVDQNDLEEEEGAIIGDDPQIHEQKAQIDGNKRKRQCKFFSRGHCSKGDSCPFEHSPTSTTAKRPKKSKNEAEGTSRSTIFENLLKIEEKESMIKFYECIKLILASK